MAHIPFHIHINSIPTKVLKHSRKSYNPASTKNRKFDYSKIKLFCINAINILYKYSFRVQFTENKIKYKSEFFVINNNLYILSMVYNFEITVITILT